MKIVANTAAIPDRKTTTSGFVYNGTKSTMTVGPAITVQNTPHPRITATTADFAAKRKMYGGDRNTYVVGTVSAQPDKIGNRHLDDFTREPRSPFVIPDQRIPEKK